MCPEPRRKAFCSANLSAMFGPIIIDVVDLKKLAMIFTTTRTMRPSVLLKDKITNRLPLPVDRLPAHLARLNSCCWRGFPAMNANPIRDSLFGSLTLVSLAVRVALCASLAVDSCRQRSAVAA